MLSKDVNVEKTMNIKKVTTYITSDGSEFKEAQVAYNYELKCQIAVLCYKHDLILKDDIYEKLINIVIDNAEELHNLLEQYIDRE